MTKYYKLLSADGSACNGGKGKWHLPTSDQPGEWMPAIAEPECCRRGYHLVTIEYVLGWQGEALFEAEWRGDIAYESDKIAVEQARLLRRVEGWNERNLRLFAADCAERVLRIFERERPDDNRPRKAIQAARQYANGQIDSDALDAAGAAAWAAAGAAAWAAAGAAAGAAAWAAERKWQIARLCHHLGIAA